MVMSILRIARASLLLASTVATLSLAGCDDEGPATQQLRDLSSAQARWARVGPDDYGYAVRRRCFCGAEAIGPVRVTVVDGVATSRVYVSSGEPVPESLAPLFPTVDGLFGILTDAFETGAFSIDVVYDPETGVPLDVFIDYRENVADEEVGFEVTEVVTPG